MRHTSVLAGLAAVLAVATPAVAKGDRTRTVNAEYVTGGNVAGVITGDVNIQSTRLGAAMILTNRGEYAIDLTLTDKTPVPVAAEAAQDLDGDGTAETTLGTFCGKTAKPLAIRRGGTPVVVLPLVGPCDAGASVPTTGTVTAKLYTRAKK
jgi:hypothetical protein